MKKYRGSLILFGLGVAMFIGASLAPSNVNDAGFLVEPYFFLIPLGYLVVAAGLVWGLSVVVYGMIRKGV